MLRLRNDVKFIIILIAILASIFFGVKRSGLLEAFSPQKVSYNTKNADKIFEQSDNKRKISMQFEIEEITEISNVINDIIFKEGVTTKYSDGKDNIQLHILEIPKAESENTVNSLRKVKTLEKENIQTSPFSAFEANVEENIKNNTITKNRIQAMINRTTSPQSMANFNHQLEMIQTKIDSLNNLKTIQQHNGEFDLIYVSAIKNLTGEDRLGAAIKKFFFITITMMIFITIVLVIVYFFFVALTKLMELLGIKAAKSGNTSNYNYGYTRGKKKIKRKYVSQEEADKKKAEEEEE
jgi:hypothetical protein